MVAAEVVTFGLLIIVYAGTAGATSSLYDHAAKIIGVAAFTSAVLFTAAAALESTAWFFVWAATSIGYALALEENQKDSPKVKRALAFMCLVSSVAAVVAAAASYGMESVRSPQFALSVTAASLSVVTDAIITAYKLKNKNNDKVKAFIFTFTNLSFPAIAIALIVPRTSSSIVLTFVATVHQGLMLIPGAFSERIWWSRLLYFVGAVMIIVLWVDSSSLGLRESAVAITYFANSFFALSEFVL
jgi:hypothetical protein